MTPNPGATQGGVLVGDFDGTTTRHDFYRPFDTWPDTARALLRRGQQGARG